MPNAGYQGGHHEKCLSGTRESVLLDILLWAKTQGGQKVFWLNGVAGAGKSTIAQSISEILADDGLLGASFFCSRDYLDRRELKNIFPTLAYQLACRYPHFRNRIIDVVKKDPTIAHSSLVTQLNALLVKPLSEGDVSCVIVIDALDECIDDQPASAMLSVLGRFVKELPLVKIFITGRPEPRIRTGFRLPLLEPLTQTFLLHEVKSTHVDKDIRLYLTQRLTAIVQRRSDIDLPNPWPSDKEIVALTTKSSGLFIFAATIVRFIESDHHEPSDRLQLILSETSGTMHEGRTGIDSLYTQILAHAFSDIRESEVFVNVKRVLGSIILAFNPLSRRELAKILGAPTSLISITLRHLHSVILAPADETEKIRVFHKSFPDFLQDGGRCADSRFHIDPKTYHGEMALDSLALVEKLEKNPCSLPPFTMNQDVRNLPQLLEDSLGGAVRYACNHWARHLRLSRPPDIRAVIASTTTILKGSAPWIEVMSLENHLGEVIHSMNNLLHWLDNVSEFLYWQVNGKASLLTTLCTKTAGGDAFLSKLATDYLRMTMYFFYPIQQCAQHTYDTALLLSPKSSIPHKTNKQRIAPGRVYVTSYLNAPSDWGLLLTTISVGPKRPTSITTFTEKIAVACEDVVNIYNAVTFAIEQSLHTLQPITRIQGSGDGSILYSAHSHSVMSWDIQTGGLINTFHTRSEISDTAISQMDGHIACGLSDGSVACWNAHTKNERNFGNGPPVVAVRWLSSAELVVATKSFVYVTDIVTGSVSISVRTPNPVWGIVVLSSGTVVVGTSESGPGGDREVYSLSHIGCKWGSSSRSPWVIHQVERSQAEHHGQLICPMEVGRQIACITPPSGVRTLTIAGGRLFRPSLLGKAKSLGVSLQRNLVVQTEDSVQIFSTEVLASSTSGPDDVHLSHIYPLDEKHVVCLQTNRCLTIIQLETLRKLRFGVDTLPLGSPSASARAPCSRGLVAEFGALMVMQAWRSLTPLPKWTEVDEGGALLGGLSPTCTRIVTLYDLPQRELRVKDMKDGSILAKLPLEHNVFKEKGAVYDLTFDSETVFSLKLDGPGYHIKIFYEIIASPGQYPYTIKQRQSEPLLEPRATPPYTLDANNEWVLDVQSRKICWIPPEHMQRGNGGHFWVGTSLVMLGSDSVVRKLSLKEPEC